MKITIQLKFVFISCMLLGITSCTSSLEKADTYAEQADWLKAVMTYRQALLENPTDVEIKSKLKQAELQAAEYYYKRGTFSIEQGNLDKGISELQQGLIAMPEHSKLQYAMKDALLKREAESLYHEALANREIEKHEDAIALLKKAVRKYPEHKLANQLLNDYKLKKTAEGSTQLVLKSKKPIVLNFKSTELKTAFEFIVKSFGINVIFDEGVKNTPVTLYAKNVTFEQAVNLMMRTTKTFYKRIGRNTILIAPDTQDKRGQYEDHLIRTFHLKSIKAKKMSDILKSVLGLKKIIINEDLNTIIVRDTEEVLKLADDLILANDRKPAELIMNVEILEVNRTKAEQLGLDFGSQITATFPNSTGSVSEALSAGTITLPNVTFRYFKQDVDAKTLANPKIRVIDSKKAKIHIGDRVPLRASTIQDATGQTRTTFEYKDIGIRLQVEPDIHLDNSVTVNLNLEVSSLGQNLGTADEPAFSIGTRNADTYMLLKDGETAILGGLIRDEDRKTRVKVPGFGDIPILGALFTSFDDSTTRTDVLLTITPHIVRTWELPSKKVSTLYSGTDKSYSTKPLFGFLDARAEGGKQATIKIGTATTSEAGASSNAAVTTASAAQAVPHVPQEKPKFGILSFGKPLYEVQKQDEFTIEVHAENIADAASIPVGILFNSNLIEISGVNSTAGTAVPVEPDKETTGVYTFRLDNPDLGEAKTTAATLKVRGKQQGISYLIFKAVSYKTKSGEVKNAHIRASRVVVR